MISTWWIPREKQYLDSTKQWYCRRCGELTRLERNPAWDGELTGFAPAPEWFVRCAICKTEHWQNDGYDCPECGWDNSGEHPAISYTKPVGNIAASMEFGGNPVDWEETHKCPVCDTEFTFTNGNY